jgi:spore germination protein KC
LAALKKAQELNTDIFGFGEVIHQKYPKEWKELEKRWDEVFPEIEVKVIVKSKLNLTGEITRPISPEQE